GSGTGTQPPGCRVAQLRPASLPTICVWLPADGAPPLDQSLLQSRPLRFGSHVQVLGHSSRLRDRGAYDLEAGIQIVVDLVRIHMLRKRVRDLVWQQPDAVCAQYFGQVVIVIVTAEGDARMRCDQC